MPPKSKVDLYAAIRRDARSGMSNRAVQRKYGVGFRTVKAAMESVWPEPRKQLPPRRTRLDAFKPTIDQMLRADLDAPRKQRHTVKRIFDRLLDEHGAVEVTYCCSPSADTDRGGTGAAERIPQTHMPGAEAEVDFGDVTIRLAGEQVKVYLFSMRLSYSGKAVHRIFASCGQEAFFLGHVHALSVLGGVPCGEALLPRSTTSRVSSVPTITAVTLSTACTRPWRSVGDPPQEQFGLLLGHHGPGDQTDRGPGPGPSGTRTGHQPHTERRAAAYSQDGGRPRPARRCNSRATLPAHHPASHRHRSRISGPRQPEPGGVRRGSCRDRRRQALAVVTIAEPPG